jgi:hypothetical protein
MRPDVRFTLNSLRDEGLIAVPPWADFVEKGGSCDAEISVIQSV